MAYFGAALIAAIAGWILDALLEPFAPLFARLLVGLVVSSLVFWKANRWLKGLRGE